MQYLQPSITLEPHPPNAGATQQPLPIASSSQPTITELPPRPQRPTEPKTRSRPRPTPKTSQAPPQPNFQEGGSSGSGSNEERTPPRPSTPPQNEARRTRLTRETNLKEGTTEEQDMACPTLIIPSKIGIQKLREVFEEANNRRTINTTTYRNFRSAYNNWVRSAGDKDMKKQHLQEPKELYRKKKIYIYI